MLANRVRMGAGGGKLPVIYGVEIDETNQNPTTSIVYTDAAVGMTPAGRNYSGVFHWGDWEDIIKNDFGIRPCLLINGTGVVNYYLEYDNYTKKADGSPSKLNGADGDVMVEFGVPLWWRFERTGNKLKIQLANGKFGGAIKPAFEIESGYNLVSIYPLFLTQILYLLMFKNLNSQNTLGWGFVEGGGIRAAGSTNQKSFCFGTGYKYDPIKFLGIEDYWGHHYWWIDGCYYDTDRNILIGKGNFNNEGIGYNNYGTGSASNIQGYMAKPQGTSNTGFILLNTHTHDYYFDYCSLRASQAPCFGGDSSSNTNAGAFSLLSESPDDTTFPKGRLSYFSNNKLYIGAYIGGVDSDRLRSIYNVVAPIGNLATARARARANNP